MAARFTTDPFVSFREKRARDGVMDAVRRRIVEKKLRPSDIMSSNRPLHSKDRERILRSDFDCFSLRRAIHLADATGVDDVTLSQALMPNVAA